MTCCGTCQNYTIKFPVGWPDYYEKAKVGRCKLESLATVRPPSSGKQCEKFQEAQDKDKRIKWMEARK